MARKFLYLIAILIVLALVALFALRIWSKELTEMAFVPDTEFVEQDPLADNAYQDPLMWFVQPGMGTADITRWIPEIDGEALAQTDRSLLPTPADTAVEAEEASLETPSFAVFFVHPTSYIPIGFGEEANWNASLDDKVANDRARLFLRGLASPFAVEQAEMWAPRYRQATVGAFLTDMPEAQLAIDAAYRDVELAFEFFLSTVDADQPIVLAGHSQGALHLIRLLQEKVAGTPLQSRIAAAYPVGWPISLSHDLPLLGLPACANPDQARCIMSWSSFAEPADPGLVLETYAKSIGLDGEPRGQDMILCSNPLSGGVNEGSNMQKNLGTLVPNDDLTDGKLVPYAVPAKCDERGLLLIGDPPEMGSAVLPGNNYHVYDIPLFWANVRADVERRVQAWSKAQ